MFYGCLGGQAHTLKVMVTELNCKATHVDKLGRTALHCAAFGGFTACIEVLLEHTVRFFFFKAIIFTYIPRSFLFYPALFLLNSLSFVKSNKTQNFQCDV